jgi:DNA polymerase (family X)
MASYKKSMRREELEPLVNKIEDALSKPRIRYEICGSYKRELPICNDLDIVVAYPINTIIDALECLDPIKISGSTKQINFIINDVQVNVWFCHDHEWPFMTLYATGNREFNIAMRSWAKRRNYVLNQYALTKNRGVIPCETQLQIFDILGIEWVEPHDRIGFNSVKGIKASA